MLTECSPKYPSCVCLLAYKLSTKSPGPLSHPGPTLAFLHHRFCVQVCSSALLCTQSVILGNATTQEPFRHADSQYLLSN